MNKVTRRIFIPLVIVLGAVAMYLVFEGARPGRPRDIREAVPIEHLTLSNGLTVVVMPNPRREGVAHLLVVKAGAADDPYGKSGLAHYLEHLMFTGTKEYPEGVYDQSISKIGGEQNAFTTADYTLYYATVAREHLPSVMAMESDRLQNLMFEPAKIARERQVITEERHLRVENNPVALFSEQLNAITFLNHPYHQPTIGWAEDMATLNGDDARGFFGQHYRPSQMVLVLAGDITVPDARRLAQRYYGGLAASTAVARNWPKEPPVRLERRATMRDGNVREPRLIRQYTAPSAVEGDMAQSLPLALFSQHLGAGPASVLYEKLVREKRLASNIESGYDPLRRGPSLLQIVATPAPGVTLEQLEAGLDAVLAEATATAPSEAATVRAKTQLVADVTFAQDGLFPIASIVAELYALGLDERYFYEWPTNVAAVTPAAMQQAARAVIVPAKAVTGYLLPQAPVAAAPAPAPVTEVPNAP